MDYDRWLWGKKEPFCSLSRHMMAVGACALEYLGAPSSGGLLSRLGDWMDLSAVDALHTAAYVAAMHDIGKAHTEFQPHPGGKGERYQAGGYRHEQFGAVLLRDALWKARGWSREARSLFSAVVRVHHQGKGVCERPDREAALWTPLRVDLEKRMWALFAPPADLPTPRNRDALGVLLSAVLILCDWVASSEGFGAEQLAEAEDGALLESLRARGREALARYGLIAGETRAYPCLESFSALFPGISAGEMRPLQRTCEALGGKGAALTIIEAPMGEGKTEAALYLAGRLCARFEKRGVYMALPTAATSNQMVGRVRRMLETHQAGSARLLHSMAWLVDRQSLSMNQFDLDDAQDARSAEDWLRPLRRGMLSENAVGTVDQAMAAALRIKYGFLRLGGLANKVLIIDEIHAYDLFMSTIIARLLQWCAALNIPVVLLSATLQARQKQKYLACYGVSGGRLSDAYPLVTQVTEQGALLETPVSGTHMRGEIRFVPRPLGCDAAAIADIALCRVEAGGCLCVMLNTVSQAQAVYRELRGRGETQVMLFHARYTAKRRGEIERTCLERFGRGGRRPERMILICTQVVEQSLDVDFDAMLTQLAPMDLLLQRAGRVHRHGENRRPAGMERPVVEVIVPEEGAAEAIERRYALLGGVYPACVMKSTEALLGVGRTVSIPGDIRACVEAAYRDISDAELDAVIRQMMKDRLSVCEAEGELLKPPQSRRFFAETMSNAASLNLMDADEDPFLRGARTREGSNSRRVIFLPEDFPERSEGVEWLMRAMEYSCSVAVGENMENDAVLRPDGDGLYRWGDVIYACSDEYGIEEVPT